MRMSARALSLLLLLLAPTCGPDPAERELLLATTTSLQDSGLLDELLPRFREQRGIAVRVVAVGSGAALRMGQEGNVDILLTHAPQAEQELVDAGAVLGRRPFMENFFVIAGPPEDPFGIARADSALAAYQRLWRERAPYVSRGDDSGTHKRELALLRAAGLEGVADWEGYVRTGSGMGSSLQVAGERRAYILSDIGTFLAFKERTNLASLSREQPALQNVYSVLRVNPDRFPGRIRTDSALELEQFLVARETQLRIAEFGRERFGRPLFRPLSLVAEGEVGVD